MRLLVILVLAIIVSVAGSLILQQPVVYDRVAGWAQSLSSTFGGASPAELGSNSERPQMSRSARPQVREAQTTAEATQDPLFWLNQGLSLFYTLLGVAMSEIVRFFTERRRV